MAKGQIIITVDENGQAELETFGFKGKGCSTTIKEILGRLGSTKKQVKKAEWFQQEVTRIHQENG